MGLQLDGSPEARVLLLAQHVCTPVRGLNADVAPNDNGAQTAMHFDKGGSRRRKDSIQSRGIRRTFILLKI